MNANVWLDGQRIAAHDATVSVFDPGFLHGDSVFEVLRTYDGAPFALDERLERLARSARKASIELPVTLKALRAEVDAALDAVSRAESYLRLMITRGYDEEAAPEHGRGPRRVLLVQPLVPLPAETYTHGVAVVTERVQLVGNTVAQGAKLGNYSASVLALAAARRRAAAEALLLDAAGHVIEGSSSNVFLVAQGRLVTPPEAAGILLGITRGKVLELAAAWGVPIELRTFTPRELALADEAFMTASIREIVPLVCVDGTVVGSGRPGALTLRLLDGYRALARQHPRRSELAS